MPTHVGALLPIVPTRGDASTNDIARAAAHAEQVGLDGVWSGDHLIMTSPVLDSTVALATAAAVTERIAIGYAVMLPALRHPAWAAKQIASLQHASRDRLILGVGVGGVGEPDEWRAAGIDSRRRGRRTDQFLSVLPGLLRGEPTALVSEPDAPVVTLRPSAPMPPVWVGGSSDAALRRALEHGEGWLAALLTPKELAVRAADLAAAAKERAVPALRTGTMVFASLTGENDDADAAAQVAGYLTAAYGLAPDKAAAVAVGGTPAQLAERLDAYVRAGADTLVVIPFGSDTRAQYDGIAAARALMAG